MFAEIADISFKVGENMSDLNIKEILNRPLNKNTKDIIRESVSFAMVTSQDEFIIKSHNIGKEILNKLDSDNPISITLNDLLLYYSYLLPVLKAYQVELKQPYNSTYDKNLKKEQNNRLHIIQALLNSLDLLYQSNLK